MEKEVKENIDECCVGWGWEKFFHVETTKEKVGRFEVLKHANLKHLYIKTTIKKSKRQKDCKKYLCHSATKDLICHPNQ